MLSLTIAKQKFFLASQIEHKITYEEWRKGIAHYQGQFTWFDDTPAGPHFYEVSPELKPYIKALFDFDRRKGYHQTVVGFIEAYGVVVVDPAKVTVSKLIFLKELATHFEGAYPIANGKWIVDDAFIEKYKAKVERKRQKREGEQKN